MVDAIPSVMLATYHDSLYRAALYANNVARYDLTSTPREVTRQPAPSPLTILPGPHVVWVADHFHGNLLRLDPHTMKILKKIPIGTGRGLGPSGMLWQGKDIRVNVQRDQTVALIDGRSGRVLHSVYLGGTNLADGISRTSAGIWAKSLHGEHGATIKLIDTKRFRVIARINPPRPAEASTPLEINGETWMLDADKLWHLSPDHEWQPDRAVDLHIPSLGPWTGGCLVAFGSLWITNFDPEQIIRVGARDLP